MLKLRPLVIWVTFWQQPHSIKLTTHNRRFLLDSSKQQHYISLQSSSFPRQLPTTNKAPAQPFSESWNEPANVVLSPDQQSTINNCFAIIDLATIPSNPQNGQHKNPDIFRRCPADAQQHLDRLALGSRHSGGPTSCRDLQVTSGMVPQSLAILASRSADHFIRTRSLRNTRLAIPSKSMKRSRRRRRRNDC